MNRSAVRELAFKFIYGVEVQKEYSKEQLDLFIEDNEIKYKSSIEYISTVFNWIEIATVKIKHITPRVIAICFFFIFIPFLDFFSKDSTFCT